MSKKSEAGFVFVSDPARRALIHTLYNTAKTQPTFGARLLAAGVQDWSFNPDTLVASPQKIASEAIIDDEVENTGHLWPATGRALVAALDGYCDRPSVKDDLWVILTGGVPIFGMPTTLQLMARFCRDNYGNSVQSWAEDSRTTSEFLNEVGSYDPAAADLLANIILHRQEDYESEYIKTLAASFAANAWRGGVKALKEIAETIGETAGAGFTGLASGLSAGGLILLAVAVGGFVLYKFGLPEMGKDTRTGRIYAAAKSYRDKKAQQ